MGIIPTKTWLKNDPLPKRKEKLRKDCYWGLYIGYEESIDIMIQIEQLKTMLAGKEEQLINLREDLNLIYRLEVVINIENNEKPAIILDYSTIDFLHRIHADFEIDLYVFNDD